MLFRSLVDQMQLERNGIEGQLIAAREVFQQAGLAAGDSAAGEVLGNVHAISRGRLGGLLEASGFTDPLPVFRALDTEGYLFQKLS